MRFQHHPDGVITIDDFAYSLEEFQIDEPNYALPEGYIGREYVPGERHFLFLPAALHACRLGRHGDQILDGSPRPLGREVLGVIADPHEEDYHRGRRPLAYDQGGNDAEAH